MTRAPKGAPSPIACRGPGAVYSIKPEISFPAGNCDANGRYEQTGIISIDANGNTAESIGTSYPTPLASSLLANLIKELSVDGEEASITLAKALMFHSAFLGKWVSDVSGLHHFGIGCPANFDEILGCRQSAATVIFQVPLSNKPDFVKRQFPMPSVLASESGLQGEVFMTLLYDAPLEATGDFEYTRCNVEASLGTIRKNEKGKDKFHGEIDSFPDGMMQAYPKEVEQVKLGYKWSPLKFYHKQFVKGPWGYPWELRLDMTLRSEYVLPAKVNAVLIVTIKSLKPGIQVYDSLVLK